MTTFYTKHLLPLALFVIALSLRVALFSGFVLGDDTEEFGRITRLLDQPPDFTYMLHHRVFGWLFNVIALKTFGVSEFSFFLPTVLMSASMSVIAYAILYSYEAGRFQAFFGGLVLACSPFEILIGTVRANDLILSWFVALAFLCFVVFRDKPRVQGASVAAFLWMAFYVKLWVVFILPALGLYYVREILRKRWRSAAAFVGVSAGLHGAAGVYWFYQLGTALPFVKHHGVTYPVSSEKLVDLFSVYPGLLFFGSEYGTTLFGIVPYALVLLLGIKLTTKTTKTTKWKFDGLDVFLFGWYFTFLLFLTFFPNAFRFDQYYSIPRIFRYLAPISFPMSLHFAKLLAELAANALPSRRILSRAVIFLAIPVLLIQSSEATRPGRAYRSAMISLAKDIRKINPSQLVAEGRASYFMRYVYLRDEDIDILQVPQIYKASEYEEWLRSLAPKLKTGSIMISGFTAYVHYGCWDCGLRLFQFRSDIDRRWRILKDYGTFDYTALPEPLRLWTWSDSPDLKRASSTGGREIYDEAVRLFQGGQLVEAKNKSQEFLLISERADLNDEALYFLGVCELRGGQPGPALEVFLKALESYPESEWRADYLYHTGLALMQLKRDWEALEYFRSVSRNHSEHWLSSHAENFIRKIESKRQCSEKTALE